MLGPNDLVFCCAPVGHVPLLDRLAPIRAAGFAGLSLLPGDIWALEQRGISARETGRRIADAGLQVAEMDCIAWWLPSQDASTLDGYGAMLRTLTPDRVIEAAAEVGARSVAVIEMSDVPVALDAAAECFAAICDRAAEYGLIAHIEFLPFGGIPDLMSGWRIVEAAGRSNGALTIDSWHLYRSGSTLDQLAALPGSAIGSIQINDAPAAATGTLFEETMRGRLLPGAGDIDVAAMLRTLDGIGSAAPIGVEVFSAAQDGMSVAEIADTWGRAAGAVMRQARGQR